MKLVQRLLVGLLPILLDTGVQVGIVNNQRHCFSFIAWCERSVEKVGPNIRCGTVSRSTRWYETLTVVTASKRAFSFKRHPVLMPLSLMVGNRHLMILITFQCQTKSEPPLKTVATWPDMLLMETWQLSGLQTYLTLSFHDDRKSFPAFTGWRSTWEGEKLCMQSPSDQVLAASTATLMSTASITTTNTTSTGEVWNFGF